MIMIKFFCEFLNDEIGVLVVEYVLIFVIVGVGIVVVVGNLGDVIFGVM